MSEKSFTFYSISTLFLMAIHIIIFIPFLIFSNQVLIFLLPQAVLYYFLVGLTIGLALKKNPSFAYPFIGIIICTFYIGFLMFWYLIFAIPECCYAYFIIDRYTLQEDYNDTPTPSYYPVGQWSMSGINYPAEQGDMREKMKAQHEDSENEKSEHDLKKHFNKKMHRKGYVLLVVICVITFIVLVSLVFQGRYAPYVL